MTRKNDLPLWGWWILPLFSLLAACSASPSVRQEKAKLKWEALATASNFQYEAIQTRIFRLSTYQKIKSPYQPLTIYIEGDGRSWISRTQLSTNPTPRNPLALKLALLDPSANVAYLARPCQYTPLSLDKACTPIIWSDKRFSESVIQSMNEAVEVLKLKARAKKIHLVGFSGGAAVAALIASRREDVASLRTVCGDLDHVMLSHYHQTTPLVGSLNPRSIAKTLRHLPQQHFVGEKDLIVPSFIAQAFITQMAKYGPHCARQTVLKEATHHKGWEHAWKILLNEPLSCTAGL